MDSNIETRPIGLPGFGLDEFSRQDKFFPTALFQESERGYEAAVLPIREYTMMEIMNRITDKPEWEVKVFQNEIIDKWRAEVLTMPDHDISERMFDWCISELRYKTAAFKESHCVEALDGVWKCDTVPNDLKIGLQKAVKVLEDVPPKDRDWHPSSNEQVLDLVHPSIYPLVYGQSRLLVDKTISIEDCLHQLGKGDICVLPEDQRTRYETKDEWDERWSCTYQWLPSEFKISDASNEERLTSYINNLHPAKHQDLYRIIEKVVALAIPLWDLTLTPLAQLWNAEPRLTLEHNGYEYAERPEQEEDEAAEAFNERLQEWKDKYEEPEQRLVLPSQRTTPSTPTPPPLPSAPSPVPAAPAFPGPPPPPPPPLPSFRAPHPPPMPAMGDLEDDDEWLDRVEVWKANRLIVQPEPKPFRPPMEDLQEVWEPRLEKDPDFLTQGTVNLRKDFSKLQIIVKLANIHLTPEKPTYEGGSWHVEGMANESIVSTALYYYDCGNISESLLAFRQHVDCGTDLPYEQGDWRACEVIYGIQNEGPTIQDLGKVVCKENRLLTFPNTMQHRVHPFHLADPTKPGHRKILALFLVDPHLRILSTADVPPQQKSWWEEKVRGLGPLGPIPDEMTNHILDLVDYPVSLETAKQQRLELMEERKGFVKWQQEKFVQNTFSLCEH